MTAAYHSIVDILRLIYNAITSIVTAYTVFF